MRRLAILFAILAAVSSIEHIVLSGTFTGRLNKVMQAPRRIRRALISLTDWRAFLVGPLRLLQRTSN